MHLCQMATLTLQVLGTTSWTRQQHVNGFRSCVASLVGNPSVPIRPCKKYQPEFPEPILEQEFQG